MHPNFHAEAVKDAESAKHKFETPAKNISHPTQPPSKFLVEKLAVPRVRRELFVDEASALRYRRPSGKHETNRGETFREVEVGVTQLSSINYQKPWPSRKASGVEELVKYMSSVPCYLQRVPKGEYVQGKALNFGVIDFRRLEKWTSIQKIDQRNAVPSTSYKAGPSSSFPNQSSYSGRSGITSPAQRNQPSALVGHFDQSSKTIKTSVIDEGFRIFGSPPISRTSTKGTFLKSNNEKCNSSTHVLRTSMQNEDCWSSQGKQSETYDQQSCDTVQSADGKLERNHIDLGASLNHLQRSNRLSIENLTAKHVSERTLGVDNSLPSKLFQRDFQNIIVPHHIPSQPFSAMIKMDVTDNETVVPSTNNEVFVTKSIAKDVRSNYIDKNSIHCIDNVVEHSSVHKVESISKERKEHLIKIPSETSLKWLNRSSSLREASLEHQLKVNNGSDNINDKGRSNSRGRGSPLRRMLDPLLKPKNVRNSRSIASSPINHTQQQRNNNMTLNGNDSDPLNAMHKSSNAEVGSCNLVPSCSPALLQDDRFDVLMRQALLKLAWKNKQPLFMFSTTDSCVLVASVRRTSNLVKDDLGGVYTIFTAEESKKKGGVWIGQSRNKKSNLLYDVVGQLLVSCTKLTCSDSNKFAMSKEYILVGNKLWSQGSLDPAHSCELAAIIVKAPYETMNCCFYEALCRDPDCDMLNDKCSSFHAKGFQIEQYPENSRNSSITAILPSGIHGFSDTGRPSSIIERWKSGGSCDCGGWDEGCWLTVLADGFHESKAASAEVRECPITDENSCFELFVQGGKRENKHRFSMIAFKEGLYTVEFGSSISSLQAFAICIATLHSSNPIDSLSVNYESLQDQPCHGCPWMNTRQNIGGPTCYVEHHPPLSPVGRA